VTVGDSSPPTFRFEDRVPVRFRDIDVGEHAHHSQVLIYIEEARWRYWSEVAGRDGLDSVDYILAEARVRYHRRILYPDLLRVQVRVSSMGRKHFEMEYRVRAGDGGLLASAWTTQVMYDYVKGRSVRVPEELRNRIESFEGGSLPTRRRGGEGGRGEGG
jgi:acyl-CoA thioester hydrolase